MFYLSRKWLLVITFLCSVSLTANSDSEEEQTGTPQTPTLTRMQQQTRSLQDMPPEIQDHIVSFLPAYDPGRYNLSFTNKALRAVVLKNCAQRPWFSQTWTKHTIKTSQHGVPLPGKTFHFSTLRLFLPENSAFLKQGLKGPICTFQKKFNPLYLTTELSVIGFPESFPGLTSEENNKRKQAYTCEQKEKFLKSEQGLLDSITGMLKQMRSHTIQARKLQLHLCMPMSELVTKHDFLSTLMTRRMLFLTIQGPGAAQYLYDLLCCNTDKGEGGAFLKNLIDPSGLKTIVFVGETAVLSPSDRQQLQNAATTLQTRISDYVLPDEAFPVSCIKKTDQGWIPERLKELQEAAGNF